MPAFEYEVKEKKSSEVNPLSTSNEIVKVYKSYYMNWYVLNHLDNII